MQETRVQRPLTEAELAGIVAEIDSAANVGEVVLFTLRAWFNALLAPEGKTWDDFDQDHALDPTRYAVPKAQSLAIFDAAGKRAGELTAGYRANDAAIYVMLELVNLSPSHYEDPVFDLGRGVRS